MEKPIRTMYFKRTAIKAIRNGTKTQLRSIAEHTKYKAGDMVCVYNYKRKKVIPAIYLKITDIRIQRLQDISREDALKDGVEITTSTTKAGEVLGYSPEIAAFIKYWNSIYAEYGYPWSANPHVNVCDFEVVDVNELNEIDILAMIARRVIYIMEKEGRNDKKRNGKEG